jgi:hypothetical protein
MIDVKRRDYLVAKALAYAIAAIETLPEHERPLFDQQGMMTLFDTIVLGEGEHKRLTWEARAKFLGEAW